jgi:hypothetical protein
MKSNKNQLQKGQHNASKAKEVATEQESMRSQSHKTLLSLYIWVGYDFKGFLMIVKGFSPCCCSSSCYCY